MLQQKIFIASPGDVCDERGLTRSVIDRIRSERAFRDKISLDIVAWDQPGAGVAMQASMTPQAAIAKGLAKPSECDIVIVILWSRIGTMLPSEYTKPDGSRYLSGTEWEFVDANEASRQDGIPEVWLYRRSPPLAFRPDDPEKKQKNEQWEKLETFFAGLNNEDGSIRGGINDYETPDQFQRLLEQHLRDHLTQLLEQKVMPASESESPLQDESPQELWQGSPYPGLEAFKSTESKIYFGRGRETDQLLAQMMDSSQRFVVVIGASGSGKSSLVAAGMLPRLQAGARPGSDQWCYLRFSPTERGNNPFLAFAHQLKPHLLGSGLRAADLAQTLYADREGLQGILVEQLAGWPDSTKFCEFHGQSAFDEGPVVAEREDK